VIKNTRAVFTGIPAALIRRGEMMLFDGIVRILARGVNRASAWNCMCMELHVERSTQMEDCAEQFPGAPECSAIRFDLENGS